MRSRARLACWRSSRWASPWRFRRIGAGACDRPPQTAALSQEIPLDPTITTGKFQNGLQYFIRTTKRPEKRAELRLVVDVGSIVEETTSRAGALRRAHGLQRDEELPEAGDGDVPRVPGHALRSEHQRVTSFDETVYMLQVPTAKPEVLDRAFLILEDWAHGQ